MSRTFKDLTDQQFGLLTAKHRAGRASDGSSLWLCQCQCGAFVTVHLNNLTKGFILNCPNCKARSCRVCNSEISSTFKGKGLNFCGQRCSSIHHMWWDAKYRAKNPEIPFSISEQDILQIWPTNNRCPVLGFEFRHSGRKGPIHESPTLDRVKPALGYVAGNIAVISHRANTLKCNETNPEVFSKIAEWMRRT